jgi:hypothetical protein
MSDRVQDLLVSGRLKFHRPSQREVTDLFSIAERGLMDAAAQGLPADGQFAAAYGRTSALAGC